MLQSVLEFHLGRRRKGHSNVRRIGCPSKDRKVHYSRANMMWDTKHCLMVSILKCHHKLSQLDGALIIDFVALCWGHWPVRWPPCPHNWESLWCTNSHQELMWKRRREGDTWEGDNYYRWYCWRTKRGLHTKKGKDWKLSSLILVKQEGLKVKQVSIFGFLIVPVR
jgi:hypothetical protein